MRVASLVLALVVALSGAGSVARADVRVAIGDLLTARISVEAASGERLPVVDTPLVFLVTVDVDGRSALANDGVSGRAEVAERSALMKVVPDRTGSAGEVNEVELELRGLPQGRHTVVVTVTTADGRTGRAERDFIHDHVPALSLSPLSGSRTEIVREPRFACSCSDDGPGGCADVRFVIERAGISVMGDVLIPAEEVLLACGAGGVAHVDLTRAEGLMFPLACVGRDGVGQEVVERAHVWIDTRGLVQHVATSVAPGIVVRVTERHVFALEGPAPALPYTTAVSVRDRDSDQRRIEVIDDAPTSNPQRQVWPVHAGVLVATKVDAPDALWQLTYVGSGPARRLGATRTNAVARSRAHVAYASVADPGKLVVRDLRRDAERSVLTESSAEALLEARVAVADGGEVAIFEAGGFLIDTAAGRQWTARPTITRLLHLRFDGSRLAYLAEMRGSVQARLFSMTGEDELLAAHSDLAAFPHAPIAVAGGWLAFLTIPAAGEPALHVRRPDATDTQRIDDPASMGPVTALLHLSAEGDVIFATKRGLFWWHPSVPVAFMGPALALADQFPDRLMLQSVGDFYEVRHPGVRRDSPLASPLDLAIAPCAPPADAGSEGVPPADAEPPPDPTGAPDGGSDHDPGAAPARAPVATGGGGCSCDSARPSLLSPAGLLLAAAALALALRRRPRLRGRPYPHRVRTLDGT